MKYILGFALLFSLSAVRADDELAPLDVVDPVMPVVAPTEDVAAAPETASEGSTDETLAAPPAEDVAPAEAPEVVEGPTPEPELSPVAATPVPEKAGPVHVSSDRFVDDEKPFNHRKSHWIGTYGFQNSKYVVPLQYSGSKVNFKEEQRELWGGRAGVGYELYLGYGFLLQGRLDGYYLGTVFKQDKLAKNASGAKVGSEKDTGQMAGGDAVLHAGWMFDFQTKNPFLGEMTYLAIEPFVEASYGRGQAYNRKKYYYDAAQSDSYDFIMSDHYSSTSVSAGLNVLSTNSGFFLNLKATRMFLSVDNGERRIRTVSEVNSVSTTSVSRPSNVRLDAVNVFTLGGGYKF